MMTKLYDPIVCRQRNQMAAHGERDVPYEYCGLLLGNPKRKSTKGS